MPCWSRWCHLDPHPFCSCLQPGGYWKLCSPWSPGCCYLPNSCLPHSGKGISVQTRRKGRGMAMWIPGMARQEVSGSPCDCGTAGPPQLCAFLGSLPSSAVLKELQTHRQLCLCQCTPRRGQSCGLLTPECHLVLPLAEPRPLYGRVGNTHHTPH